MFQTTGKAQWNINGVSYLPPKSPTLNEVLAGATQPTDFNVTENTFVLGANQSVRIVFPPTDDDDAHPFHLHGVSPIHNDWKAGFLTYFHRCRCKLSSP